jgi:hypothetical protein
MDPMGRVLDYKAVFYRIFDYEWTWPGSHQLNVKSAFTASGYIVEGSITLDSLRELGLLNGNEIQAGLYRGECLSLRDHEFAWISWVKPSSDRPDFHIPSSFGVIRLITSDK